MLPGEWNLIAQTYLRESVMGFDDGIDFDDAMMEKFSSGDQRQEETAQKHVAHIRSHVVEVIHCVGEKALQLGDY